MPCGISCRLTRSFTRGGRTATGTGGHPTAADGSTWAVGWDINTKTGNHDPLALTKRSAWSLVPNPSLGGTDSGFAAIAAIPGGGLWAVGVTGNSQGNYATLIEYYR